MKKVLLVCLFIAIVFGSSPIKSFWWLDSFAQDSGAVCDLCVSLLGEDSASCDNFCGINSGNPVGFYDSANSERAFIFGSCCCCVLGLYFLGNKAANMIRPTGKQTALSRAVVMHHGKPKED